VFRNPEWHGSLEKQIARTAGSVLTKGENGNCGANINGSMKCGNHNGPETPRQDLGTKIQRIGEPNANTYREIGRNIRAGGPNVCRGIAALEMLNIALETFPVGQRDWGFGSTKALPHDRGKKKLAYAIVRNKSATRRNRNCRCDATSKKWARAKGQACLDETKRKTGREAGEGSTGWEGEDTTYIGL